MNPVKMCRLVWLSLVILSQVNVPAIFALQEGGSGFTAYSGDGQFASPDLKWERMAEWTIESKKQYADPFNEVEVDVVFTREGQGWRVPTFWRGGNKWTVRFAPPVPGEFRIIYLPYFRFARYSPIPAVLKLEPGISYHVYYWDPVLGVKVDLGTVEAASGTSEGKINIKDLNRKLYDDNGRYRGELINSGWDEYGTHQHIHGDTYEPERPPTMGDWVLVLEAVDQ